MTGYDIAPTEGATGDSTERNIEPEGTANAAVDAPALVAALEAAPALFFAKPRPDIELDLDRPANLSDDPSLELETAAAAAMPLPPKPPPNSPLILSATFLATTPSPPSIGTVPNGSGEVTVEDEA